MLIINAIFEVRYINAPILSFFKQYKQHLYWLVLAFFLKILSFFPNSIESFYMPYIYTPLTWVLRSLLGWLPFSVGDLFYLLLAVLILIYTIRFIRKLLQNKIIWYTVFSKLMKSVIIIYCIFQLCWGIVYERKGIAWQLQLNTTKLVDSTQVLQLLLQSMDSINAVAPLVQDSAAFLLKNIKADLYTAYNIAAKHYPFLQYKKQSVKPSLIGTLLSNMGFMGYYNPFSGEAQMNTNIPFFMQPNVALHEMAHQIGYAKEDEANMVGYVVAMHSNNPYIKYSYYFDLMNYTKLELVRLDSSTRKLILDKLHPQVKKDFVTWRKYLARNRNGYLQNISQSFYHSYLRINSSSKGLQSYNEVVKLMVWYGHSTTGLKTLLQSSNQ